VIPYFLQCGAEPDPKMVEVFVGEELRNTKVFSDFGGEEEIEVRGAKRADGLGNLGGRLACSGVEECYEIEKQRLPGGQEGEYK